ncbi:MAG: hypothetical protein JW900_03420 [Anaerolineae bacterium]|nr:hypothetical protein [Anaerolineae bacterium]
MPEILWWILAVVGTLILLPVLWIGYRLVRFRRLQPIVFEYLALQDVQTALRYIDNHPQLCTAYGEEFTRFLLNRTWARGHARRFATGTVHLELLRECREHGVEGARRRAVSDLQARLDVIHSPSWHYVLYVLGRMVVKGESSIPLERLDEDLVETMSKIMAMLRPFAANEMSIANMDDILRGLDKVLQQKNEGTPFIS